MRGLLIKDLKYVKSQKMFLILVAAICIYFFVTETNTTYVISYATMVFTLLVINTINMDEQNNGMGFLFTFPIRRITYVLEKYVLGILLTTMVLVAGSAIMVVVASVKSLSYQPQEWFSVLFGCLLTASLILAITLPLQLKFGAEKGRVVMVMGVACVVAIGYGIQQIAQEYFADLVSVVERFLQGMGATEVAVCIIVLVIGMLGISCVVSAVIMKRKQF